MAKSIIRFILLATHTRVTKLPYSSLRPPAPWRPILAARYPIRKMHVLRPVGRSWVGPTAAPKSRPLVVLCSSRPAASLHCLPLDVSPSIAMSRQRHRELEARVPQWLARDRCSLSCCRIRQMQKQARAARRCARTPRATATPGRDEGGQRDRLPRTSWHRLPRTARRWCPIPGRCSAPGT